MDFLFYATFAILAVIGYLFLNWLEKKLIAWVLADPKDHSDKNSRLAVVASLAAVGAVAALLFLVKILVWIF